MIRRHSLLAFLVSGPAAYGVVAAIGAWSWPAAIGDSNGLASYLTSAFLGLVVVLLLLGFALWVIAALFVLVVAALRAVIPAGVIPQRQQVKGALNRNPPAQPPAS